MLKTIQRLRRRRDGAETEGFTLIEIMIVIVVLGILAAVVIFALGGITNKSALAACQADGSTVTSAMADYTNQNSGASPTALLLTTTPTANQPYIQSWPSNIPHYAFVISTGAGSPAGATAAGQLMVSVGPAGQVTGTGSFALYLGPSSCTGVS